MSSQSGGRGTTPPGLEGRITPPAGSSDSGATFSALPTLPTPVTSGPSPQQPPLQPAAPFSAPAPAAPPPPAYARADSFRASGGAAGGASTASTGLGGTGGGGAGGAAPKGDEKFWMEAWHDPLAKLEAYGPQIHCCDLAGDGEMRLVVAASDRRMRVWRGAALASEHTLLDHPTALTSHYLEGPSGSVDRIPNLAVACGPNVYMYRNLKPYFKYTLSMPEVHANEVSVWERVQEGDLGGAAVKEALVALRGTGVALSQGSTDLASIEDPSLLETAARAWAAKPLAEQSTVTCMCSIDTYPSGGGRLESSLVLGTEDGRVVVMDRAAMKAAREVVVGTPIHAMRATGCLQGEYRLAVATRTGRVYIIVNGEVRPSLTLQLEAYVVDLVAAPGGIFVACMNDTLSWFGWSGERLGSKHLPSAPLALDALAPPPGGGAARVPGVERESVVVVGLADGTVQTFRDLSLLNTAPLPGRTPPTGLRVGPFGREDRALVAVLATGALNIRFMPRSVKLEPPPTASGAPSGVPEAGQPLPVPKKTRFFLELMEREKEEFQDMHQLFQRDLFLMRVRAARAYVRVLTDGGGPVSYAAGQNLRMQSMLMGLGPNFKLRVSIQNSGTRPVRDVSLVMKADERLYEAAPLIRRLPALLPGVEHSVDLQVRCLNPEIGLTGEVSVIAYTSEGPMPLMVAVTKMPPSDLSSLM